MTAYRIFFTSGHTESVKADRWVQMGDWIHFQTLSKDSPVNNVMSVRAEIVICIKTLGA